MLKIVGTMGNLRRVFEQADKYDRAAGMFCYTRYNDMLRRLGRHYGFTLAQTAAGFVSLSPNNDYLKNLRSLVTLMFGIKSGARVENCTVSTYNECRTRAWRYLKSQDADRLFLRCTEGRKIKAFYKNILNPNCVDSPLVVDGHIVNAWSIPFMVEEETRSTVDENYLGESLVVEERGKVYVMASPLRTMKQVALAGFSYDKVEQDLRELQREIPTLLPCQVQATLWFTWKRINNVLYDANLDLFDDHWDLDRNPLDIRPYKIKLESSCA